MKAKFTQEEIFRAMCNTDMGCCYIDNQKQKDTILLDNDKEGNAQYGWLILKVFKGKIKLSSGDRLLSGERFYSWNFSPHDDAYQLVNLIANFTQDYFSSFEVARRVGSKVLFEGSAD